MNFLLFGAGVCTITKEKLQAILEISIIIASGFGFSLCVITAHINIIVGFFVESTIKKRFIYYPLSV